MAQALDSGIAIASAWILCVEAWKEECAAGSNDVLCGRRDATTGGEETTLNPQPPAIRICASKE
jgi:hypothetical protein